MIPKRISHQKAMKCCTNMNYIKTDQSVEAVGGKRKSIPEKY
jgi:hypothetical protein